MCQIVRGLLGGSGGTVDASAYLIEGPAGIARGTSIGIRKLLRRKVKLSCHLHRLFRDHGEGLCCLRDAACHKLLAQTLTEFRGNGCWTYALGNFCWQLCQSFIELVMQSDCILSGGLHGLDAVA